MGIRTLLPANKIYKNAINNYDRPDLILYGSASSGKSEIGFGSEVIKFITVPGYNCIWARKKRNTVKKSIFPLVKKNIARIDDQIFKLHGIKPYKDIIRFNHTDLIVENTLNGNMAFGVGMNDEEQMENVKSITAQNGEIQSIVMEEASQFDEEDYNQFGNRLRGMQPDNFVIKTPGKQKDIQIKKRITMMFNPIYINHWLKKKFQITDDGKGRAYSKNKLATVLKTTYKDNRFLEPEDHKRLEAYKETSPYFYQVYCLGNWGVLSDHDVVIPYHLIHKMLDLNIEPTGELQVGVDAARYGKDNSVIYIGQGGHTYFKRVIPFNDGIELALQVIADIKEVRANYKLGDLRVNIKNDITGIGTSCGDYLYKYAGRNKNFNMAVFEVNFGSSKVNDPERFPNVISEMYHEMKEKIKNLEIDFDQERDQQAIDEMSQRKYKIDNKTSLPMVQDKESFKKDLGDISPDESDAWMLRHYSPVHQLRADQVRAVKKEELQKRLAKKFNKYNKFNVRSRDGKRVIKQH